MQIGLFGLLTIIFVVAKLAGWIAWSWWIVFAPLYAGFVLAVFVFLVVALGLFAARNDW